MTPIESWEEELKQGLQDEVRTIRRMISLMNPQSEEEFEAVVLPNLHIFAHSFIRTKLDEAYRQGREDFKDLLLNTAADTRSDWKEIGDFVIKIHSDARHAGEVSKD